MLNEAAAAPPLLPTPLPIIVAAAPPAHAMVLPEVVDHLPPSHRLKDGKRTKGSGEMKQGAKRKRAQQTHTGAGSAPPIATVNAANTVVALQISPETAANGGGRFPNQQLRVNSDNVQGRIAVAGEAERLQLQQLQLWQFMMLAHTRQ
jgi:hypothetical protein